MKKKIALLLAALMIFGAAIPMHVFAAYSDYEVTWTYSHTGSAYQLATDNEDLVLAPLSFTDVFEGGQPSHLRLEPTREITNDMLTKGVGFDLVLTNGEWAFSNDAATIYDTIADDTPPATWSAAPANTPTYVRAFDSQYLAGSQTYIYSGTAVGAISYTLQISDMDRSVAHVVVYGNQGVFGEVIRKNNPAPVTVAGVPTAFYPNGEFVGHTEDIVGATVTAGDDIMIPLVFMNTSDTEATTLQLTTTKGLGSYYKLFNGQVVVDVPGEGVCKFNDKVSSKEVFDLDTLTISEKKPGTFVSGGSVYLFAPAGFTWARNVTPTAKVENIGAKFTGTGFDSEVVRTIGTSEGYWVKFDDDNKTYVYDDSQIIRLDFTFTRNNLGANNKPNYIVKFEVDGLRLVASDSAAFGTDFKIRLSEDHDMMVATSKNATKARDFFDPVEDLAVTGSYKDLVAFDRVDWGIDFHLAKNEKVAEIWAGRIDQDMPECVFEELAPVSWWAENVTDFTLVDAEGKSLANKVKLQNVVITDENNIAYLTPVVDDDNLVPTTTGVVRSYYDKFSVYNTPITDSEHRKGLVSFTTTISASANYAGPVYLKATGRGIPTGTDVPALLIANVSAPVEIQTKTTYVEVGYQTVPVADIRIIEKAADLFEKARDLEVGIQVFDNFNEVVDVQFIDAARIKLTPNAGNGLLGTPDIQGNVITIPVSRNSSTVPMDFTLSGLKLYIDRAIPEGHYDVVVGGDAIVDNWYERPAAGPSLSNTNPAHRGQFNVFGVTSYNYAEVKTPGINKALSKNVVVTTDTPNVAVVDGVSTELASAIYIDVTTGRTMVPISFIAQSLGIEAKNVIWDPTEAKVIVVTAERTVEFFIHTNKYTINGAARYMVENGVAVNSVITNERSYIPFTYLAQAFGITVAWDAAKHLAIYNPTVDQITAGAVVIDSIATFSTAQ